MNDFQQALKSLIEALPADAQERLDSLNEIKEALHVSSPISQPVNLVRWVAIDSVSPNDYNPNRVAQMEMRLLYTSIKQDGYTQPIVTIYDPDKGKYIIVDGFHRYWTARSNPDILERNNGRVPIVVIDKSIADRIAATVRHNRARGKHTTQGMGGLVYKMLKEGLDDASICSQLGMEAEELARLKHMTGFSALFKGRQYDEAWEAHTQIKIRHDEAEEPEDDGNG